METRIEAQEFLCTETERFNVAQSATQWQKILQKSWLLKFLCWSLAKRLLFLAELVSFLEQTIHFIVILKIFVSWSDLPWIKQVVEGKSSCCFLVIFSLKKPKSGSSVSSRNFEIDLLWPYWSELSQLMFEGKGTNLDLLQDYELLKALTSPLPVRFISNCFRNAG